MRTSLYNPWTLNRYYSPIIYTCVRIRWMKQIIFMHAASRKTNLSIQLNFHRYCSVFTLICKFKYHLFNTASFNAIVCYYIGGPKRDLIDTIKNHHSFLHKLWIKMLKYNELLGLQWVFDLYKDRPVLIYKYSIPWFYKRVAKPCIKYPQTFNRYYCCYYLSNL